MPVENALLIGCGAMGRMVLSQLEKDGRVRVASVLAPAAERRQLQEALGEGVEVVSELSQLRTRPDFALECAGHSALSAAGAVPQLLRQGIDAIVASVGALAEPGLPEFLSRAAEEGNARLTLVPGALPGIDALAAAALTRLDEVSYTGRKPPAGWLGTPAEELLDLRALQQAAMFFEGSAREAARLYPKNANVAAMVALAGVGFERTRVRLIADPGVTRNTHRLCASGEFGELDVTVAAHALQSNPKTSALAAYSIVRAVLQRVQRIVF